MNPLTVTQRQARHEDLQFMADTGEGLTGAAQRLGMTRTALEKWLSNNDKALLQRLREHDCHIDPGWANQWSEAS